MPLQIGKTPIVVLLDSDNEYAYRLKKKVNIHHVAIIVSDYEKARDFYVNKLGFAVVRENFRKERNDWKLDLRVGDGADAIELEIFAEPNPPKRVNRPEACGLRHLAFRVDDVEATVAELAQMGIDDIFVRYLMQYEILLGQVTKEHTQKEVTDYIKKVYNPANKDRQIGFQPTRKLGRTYKEDDLTYNRNLLGHADIEKVVSEEKIRQLSRSIMDVLWFSLWNKAK